MFEKFQIFLELHLHPRFHNPLQKLGNEKEDCKWMDMGFEKDIIITHQPIQMTRGLREPTYIVIIERITEI